MAAMETPAHMTAPSEAEQDGPPPSDHLDEVEDGCGCAEVWEHLSEQREAEE